MAFAYYVTQIKPLHVIAIITVAQCFRGTLLHRELRDYSLGQIAFPVFKICAENLLHGSSFLLSKIFQCLYRQFIT